MRVSRLTIWKNDLKIYYLGLPYETEKGCKMAVLLKQDQAGHNRYLAFSSHFLPDEFIRLIAEKYALIKSSLKPGMALPLSMSPGVKLGFSVDPNAQYKKEELNIVWKDRSGHLMDLAKLKTFHSIPSDFPIKNRSVWDMPEENCR